MAPLSRKLAEENIQRFEVWETVKTLDKSNAGNVCGVDVRGNSIGAIPISNFFEIRLFQKISYFFRGISVDPVKVRAFYEKSVQVVYKDDIANSYVYSAADRLGLYHLVKNPLRKLRFIF